MEYHMENERGWVYQNWGNSKQGVARGSRCFKWRSKGYKIVFEMVKLWNSNDQQFEQS